MDTLHTTFSPGQKNFDEFLKSLVPPEHQANFFLFAQSLVDIYRKVKSLQMTWHLQYYHAEKKFLKFCSEELFVHLPFPRSYDRVTSALKLAYYKAESLRSQKSRKELEQILVRETFLFLGVDFPI